MGRGKRLQCTEGPYTRVWLVTICKILSSHRSAPLPLYHFYDWLQFIIKVVGPQTSHPSSPPTGDPTTSPSRPVYENSTVPYGTPNSYAWTQILAVPYFGYSAVSATSGTFRALFVAYSDGSNAGIMYSLDSGNTFQVSDTSGIPSFSTAQFVSMTASSDNGQYVLVGTTSSYYYTTDFGKTFGVGASTDSCAIIGIGVSHDGKYMIAVDSARNFMGGPGCGASNSVIYTSNDYGVSWAAQSTGNIVYSAAMSSTGQYVLIGCTDGQFAGYVSSDYGSTYTKKIGTGNGCYIFNTQVSSSGQYQIWSQCFNGDPAMMVSSDYGNTWNPLAIPSSLMGGWGYFVSAMSSASGLALTMLPSGGGSSFFSSTTYGSTWTTINVPYRYGALMSIAADSVAKRIIVITASGLVVSGYNMAMLPSGQPTGYPSIQPVGYPTGLPSNQPVSLPTTQPSHQPDMRPSGQPVSRPSSVPSMQPRSTPSIQPVSKPTIQPSRQPSSHPTVQPSSQPSSQPSTMPSEEPSSQPSSQPSTYPTLLTSWYEKSFVGAVKHPLDSRMSTTLPNLGEGNANVFLTIGVVTVYKTVTGAYVTVQAQLDDGSYRTVVSPCVPSLQDCRDASFEFYYCAANVNVGAYLRNEYGGSLKLVATLSTGDVVTEDVCVYRPSNTTKIGSVEGQFFMKYVLSNYLQPTMVPTLSPQARLMPIAQPILIPTISVISCSAGQYLMTSTNTLCQNCPSNRWSNAGQTACSVCPAGNYLMDTGECNKWKQNITYSPVR
jgi:photosystem II stability/assembly factor-like uncharacterized protein